MEEVNNINVHKIDSICLTTDNFRNYILDNSYNENMFNPNGKINPDYNNFKKTGLISDIFEDHWENYYTQNKEMIDKYRPNANTEINKIINCHNKKLGCSVYECPECHDFIFIGHTCKSRLCTSCGYKYKLIRVNNILEHAYNCSHRQMVFTIPEELRCYFFFPFDEMIDILFEAVDETIYSVLNETYRSKKKKRKKKKYSNKSKYTPGFFMFLHTFGRDLKWNPHIHVLIAEIKMGGDLVYKNWNYFNYDALSKRFQKILLDLLSKKLGKSFDKMKRDCFNKHKNGFYVYAEPKKFKSFQDGVEYVTRYCGRPAISENRILNYDGQNVTFCYNDHKDDSYHEVTCTAYKFIEMILRHLIPYNYRTIRYCGFYRNKHKNHDKMVMMINPAHHAVRRQILGFRLSILRYFNRDPLRCPKCNTMMKYACEIIGGG